MNSGARRADFFVLEAGEYLDELEPLVLRVEQPDPERLVRGARALRGAALMAGLGTYARAAAALESVARQVRDHALGWEGPPRDAWREGIGSLRALMSRAADWRADEDRQALALAERFDLVASGRGPAMPPGPHANTMSVRVPNEVQQVVEPATATLTPGVRAFIARESHLIAGSLLQAAQALAPQSPADALAGVLARMRSLKGIGNASELSPLPELLDAMDVTTRSILARAPLPPEVALIFADAADAIEEIATSVDQRGLVIEPVLLASIAERLSAGYVSEDDVVQIAALAPDGIESVQQVGQLPPAPAPRSPVPIELVGVGDHLLVQAAALRDLPSTPARDLRLFVLHRTLATMPARHGTGQFLRPLAEVIMNAISEGTAGRDPDSFCELLEKSGHFLVAAAESADEQLLLQERTELLTRINPQQTDSQLEAHEETDALAELTGTPIVAIASLDYDQPQDDIVDIAALAPDDDVISIEQLGFDSPARNIDESTRLERAYRTLSKLEADNQPQEVAIEVLLFRGERALARAEEVRTEIGGVLSQPSVSLDALRPLIDELLDLVPLARDAA